MSMSATMSTEARRALQLARQAQAGHEVGGESFVRGDLNSDFAKEQALDEQINYLTRKQKDPAAKVKEPKVPLEHLIPSFRENSLSEGVRNKLIRLYGLIGAAEQAEASTNSTDILRIVKQSYKDAALPAVNNDAVDRLFDYLIEDSKGDEAARRQALMHFSDSADVSSISQSNAFTRPLSSIQGLNRLLEIARGSSDLRQGLAGLKNDFLKRHTDPALMEAFGQCHKLRERLTNEVLSDCDVLVRGGANIEVMPGDFLTPIVAIAADLRAVKDDPNITNAKTYNLKEILRNLTGARNEDEVVTALRDYHEMLSIVDHRYANASNALIREAAANNRRRIFQVVTSSRIMGELLPIFQSQYLAHQDVAREVLGAAKLNERMEDSLAFDRSAERLGRIGIPPAATNYADFHDEIDDLGRHYATDLQNVSDQAYQAIFKNDAADPEDVLRVNTAKRVFEYFDNDAGKIRFTKSAEQMQEALIDNICDMFEADPSSGGDIDLTSTGNAAILDILFDSVYPTNIAAALGGSGIINPADLRTDIVNQIDNIAARCRGKTVLVSGTVTHNEINSALIEDLAVYDSLRNFASKPNGVVNFRDFSSELIERGLLKGINASAFTGLLNDLVDAGHLTAGIARSYERDLAAYASDTKRAAAAYRNLYNVIEGGTLTQEDLKKTYVAELMSAFEIDTARSFVEDSEMKSVDLGNRIKSLVEDIKAERDNNQATRWLYGLLRSDEAMAKGLAPNEKHPWQGEQGVLGFLLSDPQDSNTSDQARIVALAGVFQELSKEGDASLRTAVRDYLETKLGTTMKANLHIFGNVNAINYTDTSGTTYNFSTAGALATRVNNAVVHSLFLTDRCYDHYLLELATLDDKKDSRQSFVFTRMQNSLGKAYLRTEKAEDLKQIASGLEAFVDEVTEGHEDFTINGWLQHNRGSVHEGTINLIESMVEDATALDRVDLLSDTREDLSHEQRNFLIKLIQEFVKTVSARFTGTES